MQASRYPRLSLSDRTNLRIERPETPVHIAGLCVVEARPLLGPDGEVDLETIRRRLERRLARVPELRRVVHRPPPLCGPALWVDDPRFSIDRHVQAVRVGPPGDEASLLRAAELLLRPLLDRSHPLWEVWFLTGLADGRVGVLFKIHHAIADGLAAIALMASLLDLEPDAPDPPDEAWRPAPAPPALALMADSLCCRAASAGSILRHPLRGARSVARAAADTAAMLRLSSGAPRTSINGIPGAAHRIGAVHLDLEQARTAAHTHAATVNDVVLTVVAGGVRELLEARSEPTEGLELKVTVPASLRRAGAARELGNEVGGLLVSLPVGEPDVIRRLELTAAATHAAKVAQQPAYVQGLMGWMAATGLWRPLVRRQRMVNFFVTNVPGPRETLYLLGARIDEVLPITGPAGNVTVVFAALSYHGRLDVIVNADADAYPDVDVLVAGMRRAWASLTSGRQAA